MRYNLCRHGVFVLLSLPITLAVAACTGVIAPGSKPPAHISFIVSSATYDFGTLEVGAKATKAFTIKNDGNSEASGLSASVNSAFSITQQTCGSTLGAGESCDLTVQFSPGAVGGSFNSTLEISYSGASQPASTLVSGKSYLYYAYVVNRSDSTISTYRFDPLTPNLVRTGPDVAAPTGPWELEVDPLGKYVFVSGGTSNTVGVYSVDAATGLLTQVPGSPFATDQLPLGLRANASGTNLYIANFNGNSISAYSVNRSTGALTQISGSPYLLGAGYNPMHVAVDSTRRLVHLSTRAGATFTYSADASTGALTAVATSPFDNTFIPWNWSIAIDPSLGFIFLGGGSNGFVASLAVSGSGALTQTIPQSVLTGPANSTFGVAVSAHLKRVYTANGVANSVSTLSYDASGSLTKLADIPCGTNPWHLSVDPSDHAVMVANRADNTVSVYAMDSLGNLSLSGTIGTGNSPFAVQVLHVSP